MKTFFLEYIWLDGNTPQKLRSKTKIVNAKNEAAGWQGKVGAVWK